MLPKIPYLLNKVAAAIGQRSPSEGQSYHEAPQGDSALWSKNRLIFITCQGEQSRLC